MNNKTIYGINSNFGGDVDSDEDTLAHVDSESNEIVYDFTQNEVNLDSASTSNSLCNGNKVSSFRGILEYLYTVIKPMKRFCS